jgi:hypothetical protein
MNPSSVRHTVLAIVCLLITGSLKPLTIAPLHAEDRPIVHVLAAGSAAARAGAMTGECRFS